MTQYAFGETGTEEGDIDFDKKSDAELNEAVENAGQDTGKNYSSAYEQMKAELTTPAEGVSDLKLKVRKRPKFEVGYNTSLPYAKLDAWTKQCTNRRSNQTDMRKLSMMIMAAQCDAIYFDGMEMLDSSGGSYNFRHKEFHSLCGNALDTISAITYLYGKDNDGELMSVANEITTAAGYTDMGFDDESGDGDDPLG